MLERSIAFIADFQFQNFQQFFWRVFSTIYAHTHAQTRGLTGHLKIDDPAVFSGAEASLEVVTRWATVQANCNVNTYAIKNQPRILQTTNQRKEWSEMVRRIPAPFSRAFARRVSSTTSGEPAAAAATDEEDKAATARSGMNHGAAAETIAKPCRRCETSGVRGAVPMAIACCSQERPQRRGSYGVVETRLSTPGMERDCITEGRGLNCGPAAGISEF